MSHGGELSRETRTANKRSGERSLPYRSQRPRDNEEKKIDGVHYILKVPNAVFVGLSSSP
ncbi:hypothetical protein F2Q70_00036544 [Brassica cretica]|uniref:Uncharacterized protein n=2 Tax=Brassica cretica TaxID=69181 RepID=A0A8S9GGE8_BRACR|nr:hypothetical protein F2Q68_00031747 [Brassica cretica]KAF2586310.1 hypothetical protein F2Q70_00036544 [Brassica cretica]KAF3531335.1 hypothetical protein DY000_02041614 [Brassica cretica]